MPTRNEKRDNLSKEGKIQRQNIFRRPVTVVSVLSDDFHCIPTADEEHDYNSRG